MTLILIDTKKDNVILANVYELFSKRVIVEWTISNVKSIVIYENMDDFKKISLTEGRRLIKHFPI